MCVYSRSRERALGLAGDELIPLLRGHHSIAILHSSIIRPFKDRGYCSLSLALDLSSVLSSQSVWGGWSECKNCQLADQFRSNPSGDPAMDEETTPSPLIWSSPRGIVMGHGTSAQGGTNLGVCLIALKLVVLSVKELFIERFILVNWNDWIPGRFSSSGHESPSPRQPVVVNYEFGA